MSKWRENNLGEICEIFDGPHATPKKSNIDNGNIFLGISSLSLSGRIDDSYYEYISDEDFQKWTRRITPEEDDIVFSYETKLGVAAIIPKQMNCCLGRRMGLLRTNCKVFPKFLFYYYLSPIFQGVIYERTYHGSTVDRIPLKEMPDFPILLPPLPEQKAIANVLSSLDDKIDLLHRQNKTLEQMAETLFRQWFVEEADEEWEEGVFGDFVRYIKEPLKATQDLSDRIYVPIDEIPMKRFGLSSTKSVDDAKTSLIGFEKNDILFGAMRAYFHRVNFSHFRGITRTTTMVLRPKKAHYLSFALCLLNMDSSVAYADLHSKGSTIPYATWDNSLEFLPSPIPPDDLLREFHNQVFPMLEKIAQNVESVKKISVIRDTLLPKLMSGEITLNG